MILFEFYFPAEVLIQLRFLFWLTPVLGVQIVKDGIPVPRPITFTCFVTMQQFWYLKLQSLKHLNLMDVKIMKGIAALVYLLSTINNGVRSRLWPSSQQILNHTQFSPSSCELLVPIHAGLKVKVKLPVCITMYHTTERYGGVEVHLHAYCWECWHSADFLQHTREMLRSNAGWYTSYPDWDFMYFPSVPRGKWQESTVQSHFTQGMHSWRPSCIIQTSSETHVILAEFFGFHIISNIAY